VPTDDETSMTVMRQFESLLNGFPGVPSASDFGHLEKWANNTAEQWNRLSPYDDHLRSALHQLKSRKMANVDKIDWVDFKAYLNKNEQWLAKKDIPVYMSSLIAFSSGQLEALADAEGMTGTASSSKRTAIAAFADSNDNNDNRRQRLQQWGTQVAASINGDSANPQGPQGPPVPCTYCGRHHSLDQYRGVRNLIDDHKRRQLAGRGGISKPSLHRGRSWRTNKPSQFSARAYNGGGNAAADRGGRSNGGNNAAYRGRRGGGSQWAQWCSRGQWTSRHAADDYLRKLHQQSSPQAHRQYYLLDHPCPLVQARLALG